MSNKEFKEFLKQLEKDYYNFCFEKDKQSLFYIDQMVDIFYNELIYQVYNKDAFYDLMYNNFKKNISIIFKNMKDYMDKLSKDSLKSINELINVGTTNRYVELDNLVNVYNNFKVEVNKNFNISDKIVTLVNANMNAFAGQLFSKLVVNNKDYVDNLILKYKNIFVNEMINNTCSKKDTLLTYYKNFLDGVLSEVYEKKEEIKSKNLDVVVNTSYLYLKEAEYININKYIDANVSLIDETFNYFEEEIKALGIKKNEKYNYNPVKDYLLGFNNTIGIKAKNIFDDMNVIVTLDNDETDEKIKHFNDLITRIFEINLVFDKQFQEYKKSFNVSSKNLDKFEEIVSAKKRALTDGIRANIFNIFRENIKIFNDVVYKTMLIKGRIGEYSFLLDVDKVKDLLFK